MPMPEFNPPDGDGALTRLFAEKLQSKGRSSPVFPRSMYVKRSPKPSPTGFEMPYPKAVNPLIVEISNLIIQAWSKSDE